MKLYLLRHAKTAERSADGRDISRALLPKGVKQAQALVDLLPDLTHTDVHCSSSTRTRQTLDEIAVSRQFASLFYTEDLYLASGMEMLLYLNEIKGNKDILVIGHNNGISELATMLTGKLISLQTAGCVCLTVHVPDWAHLSKDTATLDAAFRPEVD